MVSRHDLTVLPLAHTLQSAVPELLGSAEGRTMGFPRRFLQAERRPELRREFFRRVTRHRETAAPRWALDRECRNNGLPASLHTGFQVIDIASTVNCVGKKVKDRTIVPEIDGWWGPRSGNIRLDPRDRRVRKSRLGAPEGRA